MFREMRRKNQQLPEEECLEILKNAASGVLAVSGDGGYPYAVPVSFVYQDGFLYFHCAKSGHKLDAIRREPRVSFCVTEQDEVIPEKFTTHYRSVILFGRAAEVEEQAEKYRVLTLLGRKYSPGREDALREEIANQAARTCVIALRAEHITGKEAIELTRARQKTKE